MHVVYVCITNASSYLSRRLDYFVVSERLLPHVTDVVIRKEVYGSDHCPLVIGLADHAHLPHPQQTNNTASSESAQNDSGDNKETSA